MERARKWVMIPAESDSVDSQPSITEKDILSLIRLVKDGLVSNDGTLLDSKKNPISGCNIYQCLTLKSNAKQYHKFLEAKAKVPAKEIKTNKRKKRKELLEWSDDE